MSRDEDSDILAFFAGAVLGGTIGAGLALLFAPQSGKETRKLVKEKMKDVSADVKEFGEEMVPKIRDFGEDLAPKFRQAKQKIMKRMNAK